MQTRNVLYSGFRDKRKRIANRNKLKPDFFQAFETLFIKQYLISTVKEKIGVSNEFLYW